MEATINYWAVLVAAVSSFIVGAIWYGPFILGKAWQAAVGLTDEELQKANMARKFGLAFVLSVLITYGMAMFFAGQADFQDGLMYGAMTALFFVIPSMGINSLFEHHSLKLFLINAGYNLITYLVIGGILGAWH